MPYSTFDSIETDENLYRERPGAYPGLNEISFSVSRRITQ